MGKLRKDKQLLIRGSIPKVRVKKAFVVRELILKNRDLMDFSERMGISRTMVNFLMNGGRNPSAEMRKKIMAEFPGASWNDLFEFVPTEE